MLQGKRCEARKGVVINKKGQAEEVFRTFPSRSVFGKTLTGSERDELSNSRLLTRTFIILSLRDPCSADIRK